MNQSDEPELNGLVVDYLRVRGFQVSRQQFELECNARNEDIHLEEVVDGADEARVAQLIAGFLDAFDCGAGAAFLALWHKHVPKAMIETDPTYSRLDFYVRVYFAIIGIHPSPLAPVQADPLAMATLSAYLTEQGYRLSKTPEFMPFYVLPHVPNPESHESFSTLFTHSWLVELRQRLEVFLASVLSSRTIPQLFQLLKAARAATSVNGTNEYIDALKLSLSECEDREMYTITQNSKLQKEYSEVVGVTADVVSMLQRVLDGHGLKEDSLAAIVARLRKDHRLDVRVKDCCVWPGMSIMSLTAAATRARSPKNSLPVAAIRPFLLAGPSSEAARVLQALRWHLIHTPPGQQRQAIVETFLRDDLLGITEHGLQLETYLNSDDTVSKDNLARLLSCLSYTSSGRSYLAKEPKVLSALMNYLEADPDDTPVRQSVLQTMEQLCLRRDCQSQLLRLGFWDWLLELLEQADDLSDHTLQLAMAAFMNLSLRSRGKDLCAEQPELVLNTLANLLGHEIIEIRTCVHGSLYALFNRSSLRQAAQVLGYKDLIKAQREVSDADMQAQLDYVTQQLESDVRDASEREGYESDDGEQLDEGADHAQVTESDPLQLDLEQSEALPTGNGLVGQELLDSLSNPRPQSHTTEARRLSNGAAAPVNATRPPASPPIPTHNPNRTPSAFGDGVRLSTSSRPTTTTSSRPRTSRSRQATGRQALEEDNVLRLSHALDRIQGANLAAHSAHHRSRPSTGQTRPLSARPATASRPTSHRQQPQASNRPRMSSSRTASAQDSDQRPLTGSQRPLIRGSDRPLTRGSDRPLTRGSDRPSSNRPRTSNSDRDRGRTPSSRPGTVGEAALVPVDEMASDLLASKIGSVRLAAAQSKPVPPSSKAMAKLNEGGNVNMEEYNAAFSSRVRIPRTPIDGESAN